MIDIRAYEGDANEIASFIENVWSYDYKGKMTFPLWSSEYFKWQLFAGGSSGCQFCVTAYEGSRIVGCLFAKPHEFQIKGVRTSGTIGSWLTIHPDYRHHGIWLKLLIEQRRLHLKHNKDFMLGYVYTGSDASGGAQFWKNLPGFNIALLGKFGLWIRILNHKAVVDWAINPRDRMLSRFLSIFQKSYSKQINLPGIRNFKNQDLRECLALTNALLEKTDVGILWDELSLQNQLSYPDVTRTLVMEKNQQVQGLINYHRLDFMAKEPLEYSVIDYILFGNLGLFNKIKFLKTILHKMSKHASNGALFMNMSQISPVVLFACGFVPLPREFNIICIPMSEKILLHNFKKYTIYWR